MILLCQGAGGLWTGLGWVTPDWVDKLLLGHTVRQEWVGSTGHREDNISDVSAVCLGKTPPKSAFGDLFLAAVATFPTRKKSRWER